MSTLTLISMTNPAHHSSRDLHLNIPVQSAPTSEVGSDAPSNVREGVKVSISIDGRSLSESAKSSNHSSETDQAKMLEKIREQIKEIQEQIQEQQAQLQAIQINRNLTNEQKAQRVSEINQQLASLNSELTSATAQLLETLRGKPKIAGAEGVQPMPYVKHDVETPTA
ncbi:hypothetical protein PS712_03381 [Pseudomonas fluorescens]|uniref:FlxA-like protein n=1 Tax=Pseudomonas fluorescens TaxID=294 RepID=A0A5E7DS19_PSEFL|nr:hypothetical protein [Pseudomonas fluorescens]VVO10022.1 hypothetical protein PS712_03381 [Pseudomonas fluorescens]